MIDIKEHIERQEKFKKSLETQIQAEKIRERQRSEEVIKDCYPGDNSASVQESIDSLTAFMYVIIAWQYLIYIGVNHYLLFADYHLDKNDQARRFTAEELFEVFQYIDSLSVEALLRKLNCSQKEFERLYSFWQDKNSGAFVSALKELSCDLSGLSSLCERIVHIKQFQEPLIEVSDLNVFSNYWQDRESTCNDPILHPSDLLDWVEKVIRTKLIGDEIRPAIKRFLDEKRFYSFEEDLLLSLINDPIVEKHFGPLPESSASIQEFIPTSSSPEIDGQDNNPVPKGRLDVNERNADAKDDVNNPVVTEELHWPTQEELDGYPLKRNDTEFFKESIFGSAASVKVSHIEKLYNCLVSQKVLHDDLETKLILLARYTGRRIPLLELRPIEWRMSWSDKERSLGYFLLRTANSAYANGVKFFYYDDDGKEVDLNLRTVSTGAHSWKNRVKKPKLAEALDNLLLDELKLKYPED